MKKLISSLVLMMAPLCALAVTIPLTSSPTPAPTATPMASASPAPTAAAPTAIGTLPFTISAPGTYTLGSSVTFNGSGAAITVNASQVTINLGGNSLVAGSTASQVGVGIGILVNGQQDVLIVGGHIDKFGLAGVFETTSSGATTVINQKITVRQCNFNGDLYAVLSIGGTANVMEHCLVVGGAIGALDVSGTADRYQYDTFQGQTSVSGLTAGFGILSIPTKGILVEDCLIGGATAIGLQLGTGDVYRFVSFISNATNVVGGTNLMAN